MIFLAVCFRVQQSLSLASKRELELGLKKELRIIQMNIQQILFCASIVRLQDNVKRKKKNSFSVLLLSAKTIPFQAKLLSSHNSNWL